MRYKCSDKWRRCTVETLPMRIWNLRSLQIIFAKLTLWCRTTLSPMFRMPNRNTEIIINSQIDRNSRIYTNAYECSAITFLSYGNVNVNEIWILSHDGVSCDTDWFANTASMKISKFAFISTFICSYLKTHGLSLNRSEESQIVAEKKRIDSALANGSNVTWLKLMIFAQIFAQISLSVVHTE